MAVRMMSDSEWRFTLALAERDGLGDADKAALAIGCPQHGNAGMDFDADGVFCTACSRTVAHADWCAAFDAQYGAGYAAGVKARAAGMWGLTSYATVYGAGYCAGWAGRPQAYGA